MATVNAENTDEAVVADRAADTVLSACSAAGFSGLVPSAPDGFLFLEAHPPALALVGNLLAMTADRPVADRFKCVFTPLFTGPFRVCPL